MTQVHAPDTRQVHIKLAQIAGKTRFITVLPPGDIMIDDTVWAHNDRQDTKVIAYDGPGSLAEYALTKRDLSE